MASPMNEKPVGAAGPSHNGAKDSLDDDGNTMVEHADRSQSSASDLQLTSEQLADKRRREINFRLAHPLAGFTADQLGNLGEAYARDNNLGGDDDIRAFRLGAMIAKDPLKHRNIPGLTEEEMVTLDDEVDHKWRQPKMLYLVIVLCSVCAAVQGMDETVVNGAQIFYSKQFGIADKTNMTNTWLLGLVNGAPYLCCAILGCWLTVPFNNWFGRRGTVFLTCLFSALACFWQAFTNTWWHMFIARFALGLGIGPKSATVPIFASECAPASIRGALVMQWQVWTAFGIMVGYAADLAFYSVPDTPNIQGLNWRLMMGSAMLPAVIVCCFVFLCPESPRWYISKGKHEKAWHAVQKLRFNKVQAARDLFYIQYLVDIEQREVTAGQNKVKEIFTVPRNRRAMQASEIVMFMQQFCGVNVIAYYSSEIFVGAGFSEISALGASMGFGVINFLFALPAFYTIDTFGRRNLLLTTFPLMALCMLFTGFSFWIPSDSQASLACIALGIYLFGVVYSPGEGPVPFTYSAEAYPLYIRAQGMSLATATTWFFNFILSLTWPSLLTAFKPQGAFGWYAGWNIVGFFGVLFFVPETKGKTLEELDAVFNIPSRLHAAWGAKSLVWFFQRHILRRNVAKPQLLPEHDDYDHRTFSQEEENNAEKRV